ncbi:MAG: hypothetical protein RMJ88_08950 [Thermogemmata sp.]|nr:hypothetical protein [Thermogemmata sp.]
MIRWPDLSARQSRLGRTTCYLVLVAGFVGCVVPACRPNKRYDLLEAELRTRERELAETRAALEQARQLNQAYARQTPCRPTAAHDAAVAASAPIDLPLKQITLARGTGGLDEDGLPGDEALMVVVAPQDDDQAVIKIPGRVDVWLWEIAPSGQKHYLGSWAVPPDRLRPTWRQGWISSGYFLTLPWPRPPHYDRVRIAVRFTTLDGRVFETDRDVRIRPLAPASALPAGPSPSVSPPSPPRTPLLPDPLPPAAPLPGASPPVEELPPPAPSERPGS